MLCCVVLCCVVLCCVVLCCVVLCCVVLCSVVLCCVVLCCVVLCCVVLCCVVLCCVVLCCVVLCCVVLCGPGVSRESKVNVDLTQGTALIPLLFIAMVELISTTSCTKDILRKLLYAYGLAVVADGEATLQEQLIEWKGVFSRHGLTVRLEKTVVMRVEHRKQEQYIILGVKKLKQRDSFVYLGGAICGVGSSPISKRKNL